jgi:hypothetical protein
MKSYEGNNTSRRQFLKSAALGGVGLATGGINVQSVLVSHAVKPLVLAKRGKSPYSICLSESASSSERHAAEELQKFLEEMSGARLPIVTDAEDPAGDLVLVGDSKQIQKLGSNIPFATLGTEGFVLRTEGSHLVIAGGKPRGTLYGVYEFLEKLGCRWFTTEVSVIPKKSTLVVEPLNETHQPVFEYRELEMAETRNKDWAVRNRLNGDFHGLDESTGGRVSYYPFVHSFYIILPPEKYFQDHPEYYAFVDGRRRGEDAQLCLTNPEVLRLTIETVRKWFDEHPETHICSVSQNDRRGWCECDNCRRVEQEEGGAHSGPMLRFVNAVAAEVGKSHPDKLIDTLAYWGSEVPPLKARPLSNVRIRLCPIGACNGQPYEHCVHNEYFLNHLRGWAKITNQLYIWHYATNFKHYLLPFPNFDELAADIPMYKKHGVVGIFMAADGEYGEENAELRSYVIARLLWNPTVDMNGILNEFMAAFYGHAAEPMRAYFELLHRQVRLAPRGRGFHTWIYTEPGAPYLSEDFLAQATKLFRQAETAANDEATRRRVRKARLSIDYVKLMRSKTYAVRGGSYAPANLDRLTEDFHGFMKDARSFGVTSLHEGYLLEDDEKQFSKYMKPYSVATLESATLRVVVAPELSGRIIRMIDKAANLDVVYHPDPGARSYPDLGGLGLWVYSDYATLGLHEIASDPYEAVWEVESQPGLRELRLTGTCANGLRMGRTIRLSADKPVVHTETTLQNTSSSVLDAVLHSRCDAGPKHIEESVVNFHSQQGKTVLRRLLSPELEPSGSQWYEGSEQADGEWTLSGFGNGSSVVNHFPKDQVTRGLVIWSAKAETLVRMGLWSTKRSLGPGETLELEADYEIRAAR